MFNCIGFLFVMASATIPDVMTVEIGQYNSEQVCYEEGQKWVKKNPNPDHPSEYICEYERDK